MLLLLYLRFYDIWITPFDKDAYKSRQFQAHVANYLSLIGVRRLKIARPVPYVSLVGVGKWIKFIEPSLFIYLLYVVYVPDVTYWKDNFR